MTGPRTIQTSDHGPITIVCPPWCLGAHEDGGHRADILHKGPDLTLAFRDAEILTAGLAQSPYATSSDPELGGRTVGVSVYPPGRTLDPLALYALAAELDSYADRLRDLAGQLAALHSDDSKAASTSLPNPDPVDVLTGMARGLVERLAAREAPWRTVPAGGSVGTTTAQTIGEYVVELRAAISNPTDR